MPRLLAFVGPSGSGKTTLLEKLVPALRARGLRVGVIKNDAHGFRMDTEGKDTDRLFKAGADGVLIQSPAELAFRRAHDQREDPGALAARFFGDCDLVLVEGAKGSGLPKIEVWHSGRHPAPLDPPPSHRLAYVVDRPGVAALDQPVFGWDDVDGIANFVHGLIGEAAQPD